MAGTEQTKIEVLLDGRQASDQLKDLGKQAASLRLEMSKAYEANDAGKVAEAEWELEKLGVRMKQLRKESVDVTKVLDNLSGATMSELRQSIISVDAKLEGKNIKKNSAEWKHLVEVKRVLIAQQRQLRTEISGTDSVLQKSSGILNQHNILLAAAATVMYKTIGALRSCTGAFNDYEDAFQGVSSLTGLTGEALEDMKKKALETGGSTLEGGIRVKQGATAILDAYKMIGSQRPELLKDKEALHSVTVEAIILSEAARMDLQPAAAALTNSLNQFNASADNSRRFINVMAAGSQAGAGDINYLSQAIEKSGTTANLMGLEFEQLVALIETAAPKFKEAAVAGNSIDKVLMEMKSKQIGYRDGIFDVNAALDELSGRFAAGEIAADIFGKEHAKMVEVLVYGREEYARYQEAITGTNQAISQAAINTDTNKAKMGQLKAQMEALRIEVGEKLVPIMGGFTQAGIYGLKVFSPLVGIIGQFLATSSLLALALTGLALKSKILYGVEVLRNVVGQESILQGRAKIIGMNAHIVALKLQTVFTGSATIAEKRHIVAIQQKIVAMKTANATLAKTPWGLIAVGATMVIGLFVDLIRNTNKLSESQQRLIDIENRHTETLRDQTGQMSMLFAQMKKTNPGTEERIQLVDRLAKLMPDVIDKHKLYNAELKELQQAETDYRIELEKRIRVQANEEKFTDSVKQQMETEEALEKGRIKIEKLKKDRESIMKYGSPGALAAMNSKIYKAENEVQELENKLKDIEESKARINMDFGETEDNLSPVQKLPLLKIEADDNFQDEMEKEILAELDKTDRLSKEKKQRLEDEKKYRAEVLVNAKTELEQEDILYEDRLKKAGLFGKKEIILESEDALVMQALEKEHQSKILKIKNDGEKKVVQDRQSSINKKIKEIQDVNQRELIELKIKHNEELSINNLNAKELEALKKKHQDEEKELVKDHTKKLMQIMQQLLNGDKIEGIDLSNKILTPEEKKKLEDELLQLREKLSELGIVDLKKEDSKVDILGMTPDEWGMFYERLESGKIGIQDMQAAANVLMNVWGSYNNLVSSFEDRQLKDFEKNTRKKKNALDRQLDAGEISQEQYTARLAQLDAELDAKKAETENKQAKRQKTISIFEALVNTAVAVAAALKVGWPLGPILAAITGAMGAAQVAAIAATPLPGAESGGYIDVVREQDGRPFKAKNDPDRRGYVDSPTIITGESGREFVVNDRAVSNPTVKPVLDVIDAAQKNGTINRLDLTRYMITTLPGRAGGGTVSTARGDDRDVNVINQGGRDSEIQQLLRENIKMMNILAGKEVIVTWYGKGGIKEKIEKDKVYQDKISYKP